MGDTARSKSSLDDELQQVRSGVVANASPADLFARLSDLEVRLADEPKARAAFLQLRGVVRNRLGLSKDALGDLYDARGLFSKAGDTAGETDTCREIARVFSWRGESRDAALALVEAFATNEGSDSEEAIRLLVDAAALNFEIGRFAESRRWLVKASNLSKGQSRETFRILVLLLQSLAALDDTDEAEGHVTNVDLSTASDRTRHLVDIERARLAARRKDFPKAEALIFALRSQLPAAVDAFEAIELCDVEAELAMAQGRHDEALTLTRKVISRCAEDDLAGRESMARLKEAEILAKLGKDEEEARTLLAALRRATSRDLVGHIGRVRARLGDRNISVLSWTPGIDLSIAGPSPDRFVRREALGEGGIGSVSTAFDLETGELVALKRLKLADLYDQDIRQRRIESARREAAAASRLQHPGIGRVYGFMLDEGGDGLLVRELIVGPTLRDALNQPLPLDMKLIVLTELAQALSAVHGAGIVHHDLKPENIVLKGERHPVIIDFGASSFGPTHKGGDYTALYAAPEQIAAGEVDARADLYAFATIAFELLTGHRPMRPKRGLLRLWGTWYRRKGLLKDVRETGCPLAVCQLIVRALAERRSARPRRVEAFVAALQAPRGLA